VLIGYGFKVIFIQTFTMNNFLFTKNKSQTISYYNLRKAVGIIGMCLPFVLLIGNYVIGKCPYVQESISAYYYTSVGNYLVGSLCAVAFFLVCYKGPERIDTIITNVAAICAIGIAFCPTNFNGDAHGCLVTCNAKNIWGLWHNIFAALFFVILAYMSIFLFTRSEKINAKTQTKNKLIRNKIYKCCGVTILACIILMLIHIKFKPFNIVTWQPIFTLESIALFAFGFSWLVKGNTIFRDND
jgi:hypothetical protein